MFLPTSRFGHTGHLSVKPRNSHSAVSPARAAAFDILLRVERESSYASELLHSRNYETLSTADHALATELVMGVLRWRSLLDSQIAENSAQPLAKLDLEILIALRVGLYQLNWLSRVPARAAIHQSVELVKRARKRSAAPFVNAVLRKLTTTALNRISLPVETSSVSVESLATKTAHPLWLVERWAQQYGIDAARRICSYNQSVPVMAIRLRQKDAESELRKEGIELAAGALLASARRVQQGDVTQTNAFRAGRCAIQDEGSQLVAALVGRGARILDCCAAPGGKILAIADCNPDAHVVAVELHSHRARLLQRLVNGEKPSFAARAQPVQIVAADARNLPFAGEFDRVLADVPCSGTGTLARNPEIKWRLKFDDLADLHSRQLSILRSSMEQVARGGRLIYSTCSLEKEENEDVVERALAEDSSFRVIDCRSELDRLKAAGELTWPDLSSLRCGRYLRTLPGVHPCDGFFAAILEKASD